MGFRFRKNINFGPMRLNFSKSGVGYSVGGKGFRVTKKPGAVAGLLHPFPEQV
ncbi:MAG: DUF4236 domain-containing protein [Oscillospiraceae bacterium]